jgi:hypothetical protein
MADITDFRTGYKEQQALRLAVAPTEWDSCLEIAVKVV